MIYTQPWFKEYITQRYNEVTEDWQRQAFMELAERLIPDLAEQFKRSDENAS